MRNIFNLELWRFSASLSLDALGWHLLQMTLVNLSGSELRFQIEPVQFWDMYLLGLGLYCIHYKWGEAVGRNCQIYCELTPMMLAKNCEPPFQWEAADQELCLQSGSQRHQEWMRLLLTILLNLQTLHFPTCQQLLDSLTIIQLHQKLWQRYIKSVQQELDWKEKMIKLTWLGSITEAWSRKLIWGP